MAAHRARELLVSRRVRIAIVLAAALASHAAALVLVPRAIFTSVVGRPFEGRGTNQLGHRELPKPGMRAWGPSPDLLYSKCVYDVSAGPVRITTPVPDGYWSMSVYAENTDLVAVVNDRELEGRRLDAVLALAGQGTPAGVRVIRVPAVRGAAFFRTLVADAATEAALDALRREGSCGPTR
jgi:uncharacterized membrane protein